MDLPPAKQLVADKQGDVQYLGPSSLLSYTNEAETLLEERLKGNSGRPEQVQTIGALRKLSNIPLKVANFFPHCGHKELKNGMEAAGGARLPPREEADELVDGICINTQARDCEANSGRILQQDSPLVPNL
jgi:hypothetical protein